MPLDTSALVKVCLESKTTLTENKQGKVIPLRNWRIYFSCELAAESLGLDVETIRALQARGWDQSYDRGGYRIFCFKVTYRDLDDNLTAQLELVQSDLRHKHEISLIQQEQLALQDTYSVPSLASLVSASTVFLAMFYLDDRGRIGGSHYELFCGYESVTEHTGIPSDMIKKAAQWVRSIAPLTTQTGRSVAFRVLTSAEFERMKPSAAVIH